MKYVVEGGGLFLSLLNPDDKCSHFIGMDSARGMVNKKHPIFKMGMPVEKVDFICGAAFAGFKDIAVLSYPAGTRNYFPSRDGYEESNAYSAMVAFPFGKGKVVMTTDQGMFRNFVGKTSDGKELHITITGDDDNANLFINMMRWLSPKITAEMLVADQK